MSRHPLWHPPHKVVLNSIALLFCSSIAFAGSFPITMDALFDDWAAVPLAADDVTGDGGGSGIDFDRLWIANDGPGLFIRFETGVELVPQESNNLVIYIDTDNNGSTGSSVAGMGADLIWEFGNRIGTYQGSTVYWDDIGLVTSPSYSGTDFEIHLLRNATPGGSALFTSGTIRVALRDNGGGGDWIPSSSTSALYSFDDSDPQTPSTISLGKSDAEHVRVMTYNVLNDGLWDRPNEFERLLQAIDADIIAFQEIYNHTGDQTKSWVQSRLPGTWYLSWDFERQILSRYPFLGEWSTGNGWAWAALIDLPSTFDHDLLVIDVHLKCCSSGDSQRQEQIDDVMSFIRDAQSAGGSITLPQDTPIMILGDTNMYGDAQQVATLLTGDIWDNGTYGPDFNPDWDGSDLDAILSRQPAVRHSYSYYNEGSSYGPSHIDRITLTGSVIDVDKSFILHTPRMPASMLAAAGLNASDSRVASDHIPHVVDLAGSAVTTDVASSPPGSPKLMLSNDPNPFNPLTSIRFTLPAAGDIRLAVYDVRGRNVTVIAEGHHGAGEFVATWNGTDEAGGAVASGVYFARLETGDLSATRRMVLIR